MYQPRIVLVVLKGGKPHEPVEAVVIGGDEAGTTSHTTGLTLELKLHPLCLIVEGVIPSALKDHFCTFLCDAG